MAYNKWTEWQLSLSEISEHANQPIASGYNFPKQSFGKTKPVHRAFQQLWFGKWKWLHYDSAKDLCFYHTCVSAVKLCSCSYYSYGITVNHNKFAYNI